MFTTTWHSIRLSLAQISWFHHRRRSKKTMPLKTCSRTKASTLWTFSIWRRTLILKQRSTCSRRRLIAWLTLGTNSKHWIGSTRSGQVERTTSKCSVIYFCIFVICTSCPTCSSRNRRIRAASDASFSCKRTKAATRLAKCAGTCVTVMAESENFATKWSSCLSPKRPITRNYDKYYVV